MAVWKPVRADGKRECPVCTNSYRAEKSGAHAVVAHFDYGVQPRRWCPGGAVPVDPFKRTAPIGGRPRAA
jgi:hypothetical protein